jgi:hypothetical protein
MVVFYLTVNILYPEERFVLMLMDILSYGQKMKRVAIGPGLLRINAP